MVEASAGGVAPLVREGHHARTVLRTPVAEHEGPAGVACGTESGEHLVDALGPYGRPEEPFCGEPGRLEDPVASGQRLLRQPALRDVRQHALPRRDPSRSLHEDRVIVDPDHAPVGPDDPVVDIEGVSGRIGALGFHQYPLAVVGVQHGCPEAGLVHPPFGRVPGEPLVLRADVQGRAQFVHGVHVDGHRHLLHQVAIAHLRLAETLLGLHALGDVERDALPEQGRSAIVTDQDGLVVEPDHATVFGDRAILPAPAVILGGLLRLQDPRAVVGMQPLAPQGRVGQPLSGGVPVHMLDLRADVEVATRGGFLDVGDRWELLHERPEPRLGLTEAVLGLALLRDVEHDALIEGAAARACRHGHGLVAHPHPGAVEGLDPVLLGERGSCQNRPVPRGEHPIEIVRVESS